MRIKVLKDAKGRIVATTDQTQNPLVQVEPMVEKGAKLERDVEVPDNYEFKLHTFYQKTEKLKR